MVKARSGSKGLPGKNIKLICGKPLIAWAVEVAIKSPSVDYVFVTTDSIEIANIAKEYGAKVPFIRPSEFAGDKTHDGEVLLNAVETLEKDKNLKFDVILTLHPTSPLRIVEDIEKCIELITSNSCGSAMSVSKVSKTPYWMYYLQGNRLIKFVDDDKDYHNMERQQLPKVYGNNGIVYATRVSAIKDQKVMITQDVMGFEVDSNRAVSIDYMTDFMLAEFLLQDMLGKDN